MKSTMPLVSVIIPMYNVEKFITQTLESLRCQTMQDFEIIVVDDCSTDNSFEIVKNLSAQFQGRLNLIKLSKNSGTPAIPKNIAIRLSHGKYIAFLDSDDLFTRTALEEFTTLAEKFQADVLNTNSFFLTSDDLNVDQLLDTSNHKIISCRNSGAPKLEKPIVVPENIAERIHIWLNNDFHWTTWASFVKRDFLAINQIEFPNAPTVEDLSANFSYICFAKRILLIPNVTYIYRQRMNSISHGMNDIEEYFHKWVNNLKISFSEINKTMNRFDFFSEHADYRYAVLDWIFKKIMKQGYHLPLAYARVSPAVLNKFVEKEFHSDYAAFTAYLFNAVNIQQLQILKLQQENLALKRTK